MNTYIHVNNLVADTDFLILVLLKGADQLLEQRTTASVSATNTGRVSPFQKCALTTRT